MKKSLYNELLYNGYSQSFEIEEILFEKKTDHFELIIFQNSQFGRVLALDGIIQTTEKDEFIYHEMLTHVPLFSHKNPKNILIIGGGDGGILREVLKHENIESVTQVEIDQSVIDMCSKYFPNHSKGAFNSPKANIIIDDGYNFVKNCNQKFDIIISDSTDPIGPGEVLFTKDFYHYCKECLNPGGIITTQNGVAFMQLDEVVTTYKRMSPLFKDTLFYSAAIPTYIGGIMTFAWGCDDTSIKSQSLDIIKERFNKSNIETKYYNPEIHLASFALPQYIINSINKKQP